MNALPGDPGRLGGDPDVSWSDGTPIPATPSDGNAAQAQTRATLRSRLLTVSELATLPPTRPLVDGLLYEGTLAQISGAPGSFKSFVALSLAFSVALGEPFEEHPVPTRGPVVYVAAEGASGLRARILARCQLGGINPAVLDGSLYLLPLPVQLGRQVDITEALDMVHDLGAKLLVLDTRARCTLGLEENSATEQGLAIHAAERIIDATGATVLVVHHAGRSGTAGRGSTAWDGAVWSDLRISSEGLGVTVTCAKHKDVQDGCEHQYRLVPTTVAADLMPGIPTPLRQTLVVVGSDGRPSDDERSHGARLVLEIARTCAGPEGLTAPQLRDLAQEKGLGRSQAYAAIKLLAARGDLQNVSATTRPRYTVKAGPSLFEQTEEDR